MGSRIGQWGQEWVIGDIKSHLFGHPPSDPSIFLSPSHPIISPHLCKSFTLPIILIYEKSQTPFQIDNCNVVVPPPQKKKKLYYAANKLCVKTNKV